MEKDKDVKEGKDVSIIDYGLTVDGKITTGGRLVVKGEVRGILEGESVIIAQEGLVSAEAKVGRMTIGGRFEGVVDASKELVILSTGNCSGKVICKDFVVEAGGILNADVTCVNKK